MDVLDSARKRKSAFAAQLADQDAAMAQLQARLEAARVEGERLKARAEAPEAPAAAAAHAEGTSVAVVVSEPPAVEAPAVEADAAPTADTAPATPPRGRRRVARDTAFSSCKSEPASQTGCCCSSSFDTPP